MANLNQCSRMLKFNIMENSKLQQYKEIFGFLGDN
jgi:hypothetical protein